MVLTTRIGVPYKTTKLKVVPTTIIGSHYKTTKLKVVLTTEIGGSYKQIVGPTKTTVIIVRLIIIIDFIEIFLDRIIYATLLPRSIFMVIHPRSTKN